MSCSERLDPANKRRMGNQRNGEFRFVFETGTVETGKQGTIGDLFAIVEPTPLLRLDVVPDRPRKRRDGLGGMGDFRDLRQLLLFEVAR